MSSGVELISFSDLVDLNPRGAAPKGVVPYVGMGDVANDGRLVRIGERLAEEVAAGQSCFEDNDVLFAKITPCMENGKGAYVSGLNGRMAFGSTEFHVLRARPGVSSRFVYQLTRSPDFRRTAEAMMTGSAGQRRVPSSFFWRYRIQRRTLLEQQRISEALDSVDQAIESERSSAHKMDAICDAVLSAELDALYATCDLVPLREVALVARGRFSARPRNDPAYYGGEHRFIQTGDVVAAKGEFSLRLLSI